MSSSSPLATMPANMATGDNSTPVDPMITIKVHYQGVTRKCKLPLRDMVPGVLEPKIRIFLGIPSDATCTLERFSDSAGVFTQLTAQAGSVWRQLHRAAKAKSKLKLRIFCLEDPNPDETQAETNVETEVEEAKSAFETTSAKPPIATKNIRHLFKPAYVEDESHKIEDKKTEASVSAPKEPNVTKESVEPKPIEPSDSIKSGEPAQPNEPVKAEELVVRSKAEKGKPIKPVKAKAVKSDKIKANKAAKAGKMAELNVVQSFESQISDEALKEATRTYTVLCNSCDRSISNIHYHCSTCEDGDFDLCPGCVASGKMCHNERHHLIKRGHVDGRFVYRVAEQLAVKPTNTSATKSQTSPPRAPAVSMTPNSIGTPLNDKSRTPPVSHIPVSSPITPSNAKVSAPCPSTSTSSSAETIIKGCMASIRTCNSCVMDFTEDNFVHCQQCEDFDLCKDCFANDAHGHHPGHSFVPAAENMLRCTLPNAVKIRMKAGRNVAHQAICDGCDNFIVGVRNKCLDCPDWDLCNECLPSAALVHPRHRFVPIYTPVPEQTTIHTVHHGICCDGPHCSKLSGAEKTWIKGIRYKCSICHDTDFCGTCEASPNNHHSQTHPLVKMRHPVRHVDIVTQEVTNGTNVTLLGDKINPIDGVASQFTCAPLCRRTKGKSSRPAKDEFSQQIQELGEQLNAIQQAMPAKSEADTASNRFEARMRAVRCMASHGMLAQSFSEDPMVKLVKEGIAQRQKRNEAAKAEAMAKAKAEAAKGGPGAHLMPEDWDTNHQDNKLTPATPAEIKAYPTFHATAAAAAAASSPKYDYQGNELQAEFVSDTVADGTTFEVNHEFEQTWTLKNNGDYEWPADCSINFVGGDYMGHVDARHPTSGFRLMAAARSTSEAKPVAVGQSASFTAKFRAPPRAGHFASYWRLTLPNGVAFGDRMWCEINVKDSSKTAEVKAEVEAEPKPETPVAETKTEIKPEVETVFQAEPQPEIPVVEAEAVVPTKTEIQVKSEVEITSEPEVKLDAKSAEREAEDPSKSMVFPKLEAESPSASVHLDKPASEAAAAAVAEGAPAASLPEDSFEDCDDLTAWDVSDEEFETDDDYDILDASDGEYCEARDKQ